MSISYEPDWDAGTEVRYEDHRASVSSGLCQRCRNDVALPDDPDEWCKSCVLEVEGIIADMDGEE